MKRYILLIIMAMGITCGYPQDITTSLIMGIKHYVRVHIQRHDGYDINFTVAMECDTLLVDLRNTECFLESLFNSGKIVVDSPMAIQYGFEKVYKNVSDLDERCKAFQHYFQTEFNKEKTITEWTLQDGEKVRIDEVIFAGAFMQCSESMDDSLLDIEQIPDKYNSFNTRLVPIASTAIFGDRNLFVIQARVNDEQI